MQRIAPVALAAPRAATPALTGIDRDASADRLGLTPPPSICAEAPVAQGAAALPGAGCLAPALRGEA